MRKKNSCRFLIVEDDDAHYLYLTIAFQAGNVTLDRVKSCNGAFALVQEANQTFDLVLMDIKTMSNEDLENIKKLKQMLPQTPIIAQTAHYLPEEKQVLIDAGFSSVLVKPFQLPELFEHVEDCLEKKSPASKSKKKEKVV